MLEYLSLPKENLLEFEINSGTIFRPGYFIALDGLTQSLVFCIRGTMSTIDTLTDLICEYTPWKDGLVHSGIKAAAESLMTDVFPLIVQYLHKYETPNLVLCGHSLVG